MAIPTAQELNQKITFSTRSGARNAVKKTAENLTTYATAYARITAMGGNLQDSSQGNEASVQVYEIWCRWNSGVTAFMEILWGTRKFIQTGPPQKVTDSNGRHWMLITAEETIES